MVEITFEGLAAILAKTKDASVLSTALKTLFTKASLTLERDAKEWAPVDTGRLRASITHAIDTRPVPLWGIMGTNVEYAEPLDSGNRRYARGPRKGQSLHGWLTNAMARQKAKVDALLAAAERAINEAWTK